MKKFLFTIIGALALMVIVALNPSTSSAAPLDSITTNVVDLNNLGELEENGQVVVEDITYEEFIEEISKGQGISQEKARQLHKNPNSNKTNKTEIQTLAVSTNSYTMKKISIEQAVSTFYKPALVVYAYMYNSGSFRQFEYIEAVQVDRDGISDNYKAKKFEGTAKAKLTTKDKIWWMIYGDFYEYGNESITGGVGGSGSGIGKEVSVNFSLTRNTDWFKYWDNDGTYSLY
ncbi:MAG TPA: hypothetical protein VNR61_18690 [Niallia sp.]|nr:hypothetical protein [Niallia sp.]